MMFYTIVNQGRSDQRNWVPSNFDFSGDDNLIKRSETDPKKKSDIEAGATTLSDEEVGDVAKNNLSGTSENKEISLSGDDEDDSEKDLWTAPCPIGRVGYHIHKLFDAGWFRGRVVHIRDHMSGEIIEQARCDDGEFE